MTVSVFSLDCQTRGTYHSRPSVTSVWTKVTMAKDHVHVVLGRYILLGAATGATFAYPSLARNPAG